MKICGILLVYWRYSYCRAQDVQKRKRYIKIVDGVKENGGEVRIFSSLHVSGERKSKRLSLLSVYFFDLRFETFKQIVLFMIRNWLNGIMLVCMPKVLKGQNKIQQP